LHVKEPGTQVTLVQRREVALVRRRQIMDLEDALNARPDAFKSENNEYITTEHYFAEQVYGRRFSMKKGVTVTGKIHRFPCLNVLAVGRVVVTSSSDEVPPGTIIEAGAVWVSLPGSKRAVFALEDSVWVTSHQNPTNTQDLAAIEEYLIAKDFALLENK